MIVVTAPGTASHDAPFELAMGQVVRPVWERPERVTVLTGAITEAGFATTPAVAHGERLWRHVHDPRLVDWLRDGHAAWVAAGGPAVLVPDTFAHRSWRTRPPVSPIGAAGWWVTDTATPVVAGSFAAATAAVDAALTAVDLVLLRGHGSAHALTRPPGHHAGRGYIGGFCLVNHAAIAAAALREHVDRVAILDVDHHHGNGTQELFLTDPTVLYVSLHADPSTSYPWFSGFADEQGEGAGRGATVNLPLPRGTTDDEYVSALRRACDRVAAHDPDVLVVSLGTDTAASDPVGGLGLSPDSYHRIGATIASLGLPVVSLQEGGYDLDRIGADTVAVLDAIG